MLCACFEPFRTCLARRASRRRGAIRLLFLGSRLEVVARIASPTGMGILDVYRIAMGTRDIVCCVRRAVCFFNGILHVS